jgi:hypothetical protein
MVNGWDVRMVRAREELGFGLEPVAVIRGRCGNQRQRPSQRVYEFLCVAVRVGRATVAPAPARRKLPPRQVIGEGSCLAFQRIRVIGNS